MDYDIFFSYSHKEAEKVKEVNLILEALRAKGTLVLIVTVRIGFSR